MFEKNITSKGVHFPVSLLAGVVVLILFLLKAVPVQATPKADVIPVSGTISTQTWTAGNVYVVSGATIVGTGQTLTVEGGAIVKFLSPTSYLTIDGTLAIAGDQDNRVIFTSYSDDTYGGDTNGDGNNTLPAPGNWGFISIPNNNSTFEYAIVRYASKGVRVHNTTLLDISPLIQFSIFENNNYGISLDINSSASISSLIQYNVFSGNDYGFATSQATNNTGTPFTGTAFPMLSNNSFSANTKLPIYLGGSAFPVYDGSTNTFTGYPSPEHPSPEQHLGIGLGGNFSYSGSLSILHIANPDMDLPFVVVSDWTIADGTTLNLPLDSVIKFDTGKQFIVRGLLTSDATSENPTIFTSYRDDTYSGDTNGDGADFEAHPGDWKRILFINKDIVFQNAIVRYAHIGVHYDNQTNPSSLITLYPTIQNVVFDENSNGIFLSTANVAQSRTEPLISNNTFSNNSGFPLILLRTTFPVYTNNSFFGNLHPAILLLGTWYSSGTWPEVIGDGGKSLVYAVLPFDPTPWSSSTDDIINPTLTIATQAEITIPQSTVFKLMDRNADYRATITVNGLLNLQSTSINPIIFTSYKDDIHYDTNGDTSSPTRNDWLGLSLKRSAINIHHIFVKHSRRGIFIENNTIDTLSPIITNSTFDQNTNGMYLSILSSGNIAPLVSNNNFSGNLYGLVTYAEVNRTGKSAPNLSENTFTSNTSFPIYLNGTADPIYSNNVFYSNGNRGIALGGYFGSNATLSRVPGDVDAPVVNLIFPYVVMTDLTVASPSILTLPASSVIKFNLDTRIMVRGGLSLLSTAQNQIYFTSYKDDFIDDTNADGQNSIPARSDWYGVFLYSNYTSAIEYANFKYSRQGLNIFQESSTSLNPRISHNTFSESNRGITLYIKSNGHILSEIVQNTFTSNNYGLYTFVEPNNVGCVNPLLTDNNFSEHSSFPIYLSGSSDPVYSGNLFSDNVHPAIALGGYWYCDATWSTVIGDNNQPFPYVVLYQITQDATSVITIPENTIIKFDKISDPGTGIYAWGLLNMQSSPGKEIVFTSYRDDTFAGDTNADGTATLPSRTDWKTVWLADSPTKTNQFHDAIIRYATAGIGIYYNGFINTAVSSEINNTLFENNHSGILLAIGHKADNPTTLDRYGKGDIAAKITNVSMVNNNYGLLTFAHTNSSGISRPILTDVTFSQTAFYPLFFGGTAFPSYINSTVVSSSDHSFMEPDGVSPLDSIPASMSLDLAGEDLPGVTEQRTLEQEKILGLQDISPQEADLTVDQLAPGIALGGVFNNTGDMLYIPGLPYVVRGNYPITLSIDGVTTTVSADLTIGSANRAGSRVTFQGGSIIKFATGRKMTVNGGLNMHLSSASSPIIFTSIKDDSAGGDTNLDGNRTSPAKGDWLGVILTSSDTVFNHALLRYATEGLHIYFNGLVNQNISPEIKNSTFTNNITGVTLWTAGAGDIIDPVDPLNPPNTFPAVHENLFLNNTTHILGHINHNPSGGTVNGRLLLTIRNNDFLRTTNFGINNLSTNWSIDAINNYWSDSTGPYHATLNPGGKGVVVSDRVLFNPYLTQLQHQNLKFKISGRISESGTTPTVGLAGVTVHLLPNGGTTTTGVDGYYSFDDLDIGIYQIIPVLSGWIFAPGSQSIDLITDATANFEGTLGTSDTYIVIDNIVVGQSVVGERTATFTVRLTRPSIETVSVDYLTQNGIALSPGDYTAITTRTLTFNPGVTSRTFTVVIKPGPMDEGIEYFSVVLSNPRPTGAIKLIPNGDVGTCTIIPFTDFLYLPFIKK